MIAASSSRVFIKAWLIEVIESRDLEQLLNKPQESLLKRFIWSGLLLGLKVENSSPTQESVYNLCPADVLLFAPVGPSQPSSLVALN